MAYRNAVIDYSGRTVDMLLLKTVTEPGDETTVRADVAGTPMIVTGIEKLVQRFSIVFLTELGSVRNRPSEGTEFMSRMSSGRIYDEQTLKMAASEANVSTRRQIRNGDAGEDTPDDEALENSSVADVRVDRATATAYVKINLVSKAGESFVYVTPVNIGV